MVSINAIRQFVRAHPGKVLLVAIAAILYIGLNIWVYSIIKSQGFKTNPVATIRETIKSFGALRESSSPPGRSSPIPTPIPTPKTGPGPHSCDPYGVCNLYSAQMLKENCSVTFADPECLGQCSDRAKRCKK